MSEKEHKLSRPEALELVGDIVKRMVEISKEHGIPLSDTEKFKSDLRVSLLKDLEMFMQLKKLDIEFKNELYDPDSKMPQVVYIARITPHGVKNIYRSRLYVTGRDVNKIKEVRYTLHPTFPNPTRIAKNRKNNFEIIIWAWGGFDIHGVVITLNNEEHPFTHPFLFRAQLREAEKNNIEFVQK